MLATDLKSPHISDPLLLLTLSVTLDVLSVSLLNTAETTSRMKASMVILF